MERPVESERTGERIAKLLARAGVASRREIERMISEGRVARDGVAIDTPATVLASLHGVTVDGEPVAGAAPARLFVYHKPTGLLVTEHDPRGRPTIYDRLPADLPRIVPVGRLDLATEGLLLLTTDGGLKRELELPATGVERAYRARAYGSVTQGQLEDLMDGVEIEGVRYGPINANLERRTGANTWIEMILTEGKNREVRRVLEYLGLQVGRLIRTRYGPFVLGDLPPGDVGEVRQADLIAFRQTLGGKRRKDEATIAVASSRAPTSRAAPSRTPRPRPIPNPAPKPLPGERRGPVANEQQRPTPGPQPARPMRATSQRQPTASPGSTLRPSGPRAAEIAGRSQRPSTTRLPPSPADRGKRVATAGSEKEGSDSTIASRPAKPPLRKAGWAKPKPKTGPKRPGKR